MTRDCADWQAAFWQALDGELPAAESAELAEHIRTCAECRAASTEAVAIHRRLLEEADRKTQLVRREAAKLGLKADSAATENANDAPRIAEGGTLPYSLPRTTEEREKFRPRIVVLDWRYIGVAAAVALVGLLVLLQRNWNPLGGEAIDLSAMAPVATIESASGGVVIINEDSSSRKPCKAKGYLTAKDGLEMNGAAGAVVRMRDGTMLTLSPERGTSRFWANYWNEAQGGPRSALQRNHLGLERGVLDAVVVKQPKDAPMKVTTPQAEALVLGTTFRLTVGVTSTRLDVQEGRVQLTRRSDQKKVEVGGKEFCVVESGGDMKVQANP